MAELLAAYVSPRTGEVAMLTFGGFLFGK